MAGGGASRPPPLPYYGGGTVRFGYNEESDASTRPVCPVYDEYDSDDNKVFPPPGSALGTAIKSILPITVTPDDDDDDLFTSVAAAMAAEQQRGKSVAAVEHGASEAGSADARPTPVRCYGGTVASGHHHDDATRPPLAGHSGSGMPTQHVYDKYDDDDNEELLVLGPGMVIEPTVDQGPAVDANMIVTMTTTPDEVDGSDAPPPVHDDLFASIAAAMAAEQQRETPVDAPEHGVSEAPRPPLVGPSGSGMSNQCVYDEYDVSPPPGPAAVTEPTGHGHMITPTTTCGDGAPPPAYDDLFPGVMAAEQQPKTPVAAAKDGDPGVEVDDEEELEEIFCDEFFQRRRRRSPNQGTTAANIDEASPSAWVAAGIAAAAEHGRRLTAAAARFTTVRRLGRRGGGEAEDTERRGNS